MKKALVVGGTGMLAEVSLWLATQGYEVSVIGRTPERMDRLKRRFPKDSLLTPLLMDYRNIDDLSAALKDDGPYQVVVAWIHSVAEQAVHTIMKKNVVDHWSFFHVLSSSKDLKETKERLHIPEVCIYHQVQLGFVLEEDSSRWLTNDEIAKGVIDAIKVRSPRYIVGSIEPWERRPRW